MGNLISCSFVEVESLTAKLIDLHGNLIRSVDLPLTAAELMLEEQGHMVSSADDVRRTSRLSPMRADEELSGGKVYVLVPVGRVQSKLSESEMGLIMSTCKKRSGKQRSSKVLPALVCVPDEYVKSHIGVLTGNDDTGSHYCRRLRQWTPSLEPVLEED